MRNLILVLLVVMGSVPVYGQSSNAERKARLETSYGGWVILQQEASLLEATEWPLTREYATYLDSLKFARAYLIGTMTVDGTSTKMDSILVDAGLKVKSCSELYDRKEAMLTKHVEENTYLSEKRWHAAEDR